MSPMKKTKKERDNFQPESNSTDFDAEPLVTDSEATNSLGRELRAAINTMGPDTPHTFDDQLLAIERIPPLSLSSYQPDVGNKVYALASEPAPVEIRELYRKTAPPLTDDSRTENVDFANSPRIYTNRTRIPCPNPAACVPLSNERKLDHTCYCGRTKNYVKVYAIASEPAPVEISELYRKTSIPPSEESRTEIEIESVEISDRPKIYTKKVTRIPCPDPAECLPVSYEKERKPVHRCYCETAKNFVQVRRSPVMQPQERYQERYSRFDRHSISKWFWNLTKRGSDQQKPPFEYYKMCVDQTEDDHSPPRKVIFDLVDELPKPQCASVAVNTRPHICDHDLRTKEEKDYNNLRAQRSNDDDSINCYTTMNKRNEIIQHKIKRCHCGAPARVDVYYFDHGNASYLRTTDNPPLIRTEIVADQSEECNVKFWGEIFGTVHIGTSFITTFILQFFRFLLQSIIRPLTIGLLQIASDYFFKPCLATIFNAVIQPPLICIYNVCTSLRDICDPVAEGLGYFIREIANLFKACRLVEIKRSKPCERTSFENNCGVPECK